MEESTAKIIAELMKKRMYSISSQHYALLRVSITTLKSVALPLHAGSVRTPLISLCCGSYLITCVRFLNPASQLVSCSTTIRVQRDTSEKAAYRSVLLTDSAKFLTPQGLLQHRRADTSWNFLFQVNFSRSTSCPWLPLNTLLSPSTGMAPLQMGRYSEESLLPSGLLPAKMK